MSSNARIGADFEILLANWLYRQGFWVHRIVPSAAGQPADLIAAYRNYHTLIDCKVVTGDRSFPFDRIEDNQQTAMRMFEERANTQCWFAIQLIKASTIRLISYPQIEAWIKWGKKSLTQKELLSPSIGCTLSEWFSYVKKEASLLST